MTGKPKDLLDQFITLGVDINVRNRAGETAAFHYFRQGGVTVSMPLKTLPKNELHQRLKYPRTEAVEHEHRLWIVLEESGLD